jgi:hypothetical protein
MIALDTPLAPAVEATFPKRCNLLLHCGAHAVDRREVRHVQCPEPTDTWFPMDHLHVLDEVEIQIRESGLKIVNQAHALSHGNNRYFGLIQVYRETNQQDYSWVVGVRNSHDKTFPAGVVAGSQVFVCDNLAFCGEIKFGRKHTRFIERDLPGLICDAITQLNEEWINMDLRIEAYKNSPIADWNAHDIVVKAIDDQILPVTALPRLLDEWRMPSHREFEDRTIWSLFNAFTEVLKGNLNHLPSRTEKLHRLMDRQVFRGGVM